MEIKLVILSLACFSCLVPPAYSTVLTAKLAAGALAKGAILKGAALLAGKAAIVKGLAALAAKGALLGGAAVLGAKALKVGAALKAGAALAAAKPALLPPPVFVEKPVVVHKPVPYPYLIQKPSVVLSPPSPANIANKLGNLVNVSAGAVVNKTAAVGELLASLLPSKTVVNPPLPVVYEIVSAPKFYPVPIIEKIVKK